MQYPFNAADTRCTGLSAPTCKRNECQQDSVSGSITCEVCIPERARPRDLAACLIILWFATACVPVRKNWPAP